MNLLGKTSFFLTSMRAAIWQGVLQQDHQLTLFINALHTPFTDELWRFFSAATIWCLLCAAMVVWLFTKMGWKRALVAIGACVLTFALCDQSARLVKHGLERLRPCWDADMLSAGLRVLEGKGGQYGFFSAHSANAMGLAICSFLCLRSGSGRTARGYAWIAFTLAFLIGISRIFVGKHFLGDVLAGFCAGLLLGWLSTITVFRLLRVCQKILPFGTMAKDRTGQRPS